ncbi:signal transducer and activator of transcription 6 [Cyprinodon tularosa]|uniref:signal transducer and activator of transcription 6 n=1 Tax=Cyprinodon tularosa TaxID=77115 RepID=UPI0018E22BA7|nr:signal transducer and activator of transcription 6 [Cyprinodon tularosa]XP_038139051.1 signal transducer and activator of transcription 6 [Cyprinodon tularosa]
MAQWMDMTVLLTRLDEATVNSLYHPDVFPLEVRHYLANWIEEQRWDEFSLGNAHQEEPAKARMTQLLHVLAMVSDQNVTNIVERMKLTHISKYLVSRPPLEFVVMIKNVLEEEKALLKKHNFKPRGLQHKLKSHEEDIKKLMSDVVLAQSIRKRKHQLEEEYNWEKQNYETLQVQYKQNGSGLSREIMHLKQKCERLKTEHVQQTTDLLDLLRNCVENLKTSQDDFISRLNAWKVEQHKSVIGYPFNDDLFPLQTWSEQLLAINSNLYQEAMLINEPIQEIKEELKACLKDLIESSFVVEKQPPQVIKTQSKFSATVRYLLGEKLIPGTPVTVRAQIINENQAKNLSLASGENVGELINNTAVMDKNTASRTTNATFRNMSIKKIKRADRKGAESVTEEKFALMFTANIAITNYEVPFRIQIISQPVVIIVHGSQDNNAVATIIWDCAFAEPERLPFVVPDRVPWKMMVETLNYKFRSEVQTNHELDPFNQHFLAQKIFDQPEYTDDFSNMMVSWCQFNKEVLTGRNFTFWQWFEGAMDLTKKHLASYWSDGLIFGFIGKQHIHLILKECHSGTFLLRFSDSEIGGITIAYVTYENGMPLFQNIQPFTKRDLEIRSLGDRIRDINEITYLYPNLPKHDVFQKYYSGRPAPNMSGYIPVSLQTKVGEEHPPGGIYPLDDNLPDLSLPMEEFNAALGNLQIPDDDTVDAPALPNASDSMDYDFFSLNC